MAYDLGINAFDTANVYSNGISEVILGKAIKQHNLPRDEIVVMTKVFFAVDIDRDGNPTNSLSADEKKAQRLANQKGLSRKVQVKKPPLVCPLLTNIRCSISSSP